MTNFVLVHPPNGGRPYFDTLGGALVSPEAPPPPTLAAEPAPLKAWEGPKKQEERAPPVKRLEHGTQLYALVFRHCGGEFEVEVHATMEERNASYHAFLDELREPGEEDVPYDELEDRPLCGCGDAMIDFADATFGSFRIEERRVRLKKHFQREKERMEVEEVRCRAP